MSKIDKSIYPSPILEINDFKYHLKSIVKHFGDLESGHYTTALKMENFWLTRDDLNDFSISQLTPLDGYIFFYEKSPLAVSEKLL